MKRPHFQSRIADLEALFDKSRADRATLDALLHELSHRSVDRAQRLKQRVAQALGTLEKVPEPEVGAGARRSPSHPSAIRTEPGAVPTRLEEVGRLNMPDDIRVAVSDQDRQEQAPSNIFVRAVVAPFVSRAPRRPADSYADRPADILSAWTALEVLSPYTFAKPSDLVEGDERRIARFSDQLFMPWANGGERARPSTQLFYHIVLGAVRMEEATKALLEAFVDDNADRRSERGFAGIATITVDKHGRPIPENAVAISSFAWGLPLALRRDLRSLGSWPAVEPKLIEAIDQKIRKQDSEGNVLPLDTAAIDSVHDALVKRLGLPAQMAEAPSFALRHYHYWKATEPPDPPLLGSFYLGDLAAAQSVVAEKKHRNLGRYLGLEKPPNWMDALKNEKALADAVAPRRMPLGRWTAKGRHPLVLLQQAAVNLATSGDSATSILPVNGPPGTGKTTLLRDLVAALVVGRAEAMCGFDDPEAAFTHTGEKRRSGAGFSHIYRPHDRLCGFEMLVASSNNKAVENVSRELPLINAVAADAPTLRYFKSVSDNIAGGEETWGLIAAVLGNSSNRYKFKEALWGDADRGLRSYLSEASGQPQFVEEVDPKTQKILRKRKPEVVSKERPPTSHEAALKEWRAARRAFKQAIAEARAFRDLVEAARKEDGSIDAKAAALCEAEQSKGAAEERANASESDVANAGIREASAKVAVERARSQAAEHKRDAPGAMARIFGSSSARAWSDKKAQLDQALAQANAAHRDAVASLSSASTKLIAERQRLAAAVTSFDEARESVEAIKRRVDVLQSRCGSRAVDAGFFKRRHTEIHSTPPWYDDAAHRQRDLVFECAMRVHKAFIGAAAKPIRNNLDALFKTFFGRSAWSPRMSPVMPALWSTLFMVVPVVSTTFASIERMIGFLPPGALGWLLVDEAGQSVPQAAVGALMRTKRAIVVGDPLQVEPVTSLPTQLAETICEEFDVDPNEWNAPFASVQTVADATSTLGATYPRDGKEIKVGVPLLVHRRCADPMFRLSNEVAYGGLMVKATPKRESAIRDVLGSSHWVDVKPGKTEDKWSEAEGQTVIDMLRRLAEAGTPDLDLYIISPFRIVAQRLRERLGASGVLKPWTDKPWEWTRDRVGTVHTVQGREADSVILVLGAPLPAQVGARGWAGGSVNLLNVAATRAQENLYVVGARSAWSDAGHFRSLVSEIQPAKPSTSRKDAQISMSDL